MLLNILRSLSVLSHLASGISAGNFKRTTTLDATCKDGYSVETSRLDPEILICCPKGSGPGGRGTPVIQDLTLSITKGPICCPDILTSEQYNAEDNEDRARPDNVEDCWFNYQKVNNTNIHGRFVCAQPGVDSPTPNALDKCGASGIDTDNTDSDQFGEGQAMRAVCSDVERGSQAISTVGRETIDTINTICCPQDHPQGGWSEKEGPVCCQKLDGRMIECGGKFDYHIPAKGVVNCRGSGNSMVIYGNTSVCEGPSRQRSRPPVYAMPKPEGPIARPKNHTELCKIFRGKKRDASRVGRSGGSLS